MMNQIFCIIFLYMSGYFFLRILEDVTIKWQNKRYNTNLKKHAKHSHSRARWRFVLSFPIGLSLWALIGFFLLVLSIPYTYGTIVLTYGIIYMSLLYMYIDTRKDFIMPRDVKMNLAMQLVIVFTVALVCCSGLLPISISNDSYYYYSVFPQTIVKEGFYQRCYDVFLTDVGQASAVIGTLPWFFGFENTYGIQLFLGFDLAAVYGVTIYENVYKYMPGKADVKFKKRSVALLLSLISVLVFISSTCFYVMTRWSLANIYFMTYFFIIFALTIRLSHGEDVLTRRDRALITIFMAMLSILRMEGGMFAGLLILCACALDIPKKVLLKNYTLPLFATQIPYYIVVFGILRVNPLYSFLRTSNIIVMLVFLLIISVYIAYIRDKFFKDRGLLYAVLLLLGLLAGNVLICFISTERYIGNLRFFRNNLIHSNGWGYFVILFVVLIVCLPWGKNLFKGMLFPLTFDIGYVFFTVALCWARDGTLREGIGDSGNRVLMQIVPFVMYTFTFMLVRKRSESAE